MAPITEKNVGFLGCGNMAECVLAGLLRTNALLPRQVFVCNRTKSKMERLHDLYGVNYDNSLEVTEQCPVLIIGVKPWAVVELLQTIQSKMNPETLVISLAAGITMSTMGKYLPTWAKVIRVMPNLPCLVGCGTTSVSGNSNVSAEELQLAVSIFGSVGQAFVTDEAAIHGVIGTAGSAPAYVFIFMEAMADAAVRGGIPRAQAYQMVTQVVMGSAKMMQETQKSPGELKDMVCTPGGTTIEAVRYLEKGGFRSSVMEAMIACMDRSKEVEKANNP